MDTALLALRRVSDIKLRLFRRVETKAANVDSTTHLNSTTNGAVGGTGRGDASAHQVEEVTASHLAVTTSLDPPTATDSNRAEVPPRLALYPGEQLDVEISFKLKEDVAAADLALLGAEGGAADPIALWRELLDMRLTVVPFLTPEASGHSQVSVAEAAGKKRQDDLLVSGCHTLVSRRHPPSSAAVVAERVEHSLADAGEQEATSTAATAASRSTSRPPSPQPQSAGTPTTSTSTPSTAGHPVRVFRFPYTVPTDALHPPLKPGEGRPHHHRTGSGHHGSRGTAGSSHSAVHSRSFSEGASGHGSSSMTPKPTNASFGSWGAAANNPNGTGSASAAIEHTDQHNQRKECVGGGDGTPEPEGQAAGFVDGAGEDKAITLRVGVYIGNPRDIHTLGKHLVGDVAKRLVLKPSVGLASRATAIPNGFVLFSLQVWNQAQTNITVTDTVVDLPSTWQSSKEHLSPTSMVATSDGVNTPFITARNEVLDWLRKHSVVPLVPSQLPLTLKPLERCSLCFKLDVKHLKESSEYAALLLSSQFSNFFLIEYTVELLPRAMPAPSGGGGVTEDTVNDGSPRWLRLRASKEVEWQARVPTRSSLAAEEAEDAGRLTGFGGMSAVVGYGGSELSAVPTFVGSPGSFVPSHFE